MHRCSSHRAPPLPGSPSQCPATASCTSIPAPSAQPQGMGQWAGKGRWLFFLSSLFFYLPLCFFFPPPCFFFTTFILTPFSSPFFPPLLHLFSPPSCPFLSLPPFPPPSFPPCPLFHVSSSYFPFSLFFPHFFFLLFLPPFSFLHTFFALSTSLTLSLSLCRSGWLPRVQVRALWAGERGVALPVPPGPGEQGLHAAGDPRAGPALERGQEASPHRKPFQPLTPASTLGPLYLQPEPLSPFLISVLLQLPQPPLPWERSVLVAVEPLTPSSGLWDRPSWHCPRDVPLPSHGISSCPRGDAGALLPACPVP